MSFLIAPRNTGFTVTAVSVSMASQAVTPVRQTRSAVSLAPRLDTLSLLGSALAANDAPLFPVDTEPDPGTSRSRAVRHSDLYYTRLTIHRYASYLTVPLFAAEYVVGQQLYNNGGDGATGGSTPPWQRGSPGCSP